MNESAREWVGMSDLMTGLMLVFLFLAVLFMVTSEEESTRAEQHRRALARANADLERKNENLARTKARVDRFRAEHILYRDRLHEDLNEEFGQNLSAWNAEILPDNTIRFKTPEVLFEKGKKIIATKFKEILSDFFPRYVKVLTRAKHKPNINEVRIEGHTSSEWESSGNLGRYLNNMKLSQDRALSVLRYCFSLEDIAEEKGWLEKVLRASGLAFARPVRVRGKEHRARSRRVEFRVLTKAENVKNFLNEWEALKK